MKIALIPDEYIHWVFKATIKGWFIVRREKPKAIWAFFHPGSSLIVGYLLSKLSGLPLLLDYRDPWTGFFAWGKLPKWRETLDGFIERRILKHASFISVVNEGVAEDILNKLPNGEDKIIILPQGWDSVEANDLSYITPLSQQDGILRFVYGGTISPELGNPTEFLEAVARIKKREPAFAHRVRIIFVGQRLLDIRSLAQQLGIAEMVEINGHLERYEALRILAKGDVLLLIRLQRGKLWITGKIWDYLTAGRPILALVDPESAAADVIQRTNTGQVVPPWDVAAIEEAVLGIYKKFLASGSISFHPDKDESYKLSMDSISQRAAELLESL